MIEEKGSQFPIQQEIKKTIELALLGMIANLEHVQTITFIPVIKGETARLQTSRLRKTFKTSRDFTRLHEG
jgi:hypothetical protein